MEICCRPITNVFKDKVQALMHPIATRGPMDLGSWLSEMGMLWLSMLKTHSQQSNDHPVCETQFHSALWVVLYKDLSAGDFQNGMFLVTFKPLPNVSAVVPRWRDVPAAAEAMQTKNFTVILVIKPSLKFTFTIFSSYVFQYCYN